VFGWFELAKNRTVNANQGFDSLPKTNVTFYPGKIIGSSDVIYMAQTNLAKGSAKIFGGDSYSGWDGFRISSNVLLETFQMNVFATNTFFPGYSRGGVISGGGIWRDMGSRIGAGGGTNSGIDGNVAVFVTTGSTVEFNLTTLYNTSGGYTLSLDGGSTAVGTIITNNTVCKLSGNVPMPLTGTSNDFTGSFAGNAGGVSNAVVLIAGAGVAIETSANGRTNTISAELTNSTLRGQTIINGGELNVTNSPSGDGNISLVDDGYVFSGRITAPYFNGVHNGNGSGLTNLPVPTLNQVTAAENSTSNAILSTSTSTTSPAANELATAKWVRGLLSGGQMLYNMTNAAVPNLSYYTAGTTTNNSPQVRTYSAVTNNQYLGTGIMSTQAYTTVFSPMAVNAYISWNSGGGRSCSIKPEFYYSYDGTNLLGDFTPGVQALQSNNNTNLYTFVIPFPTVTATNAAGFYVVRRFKVSGVNGTVNVSIHGSGGTPSTISFENPSVSDPSLGVRGATNLVLNGVPSTYDSTTRTLTNNSTDNGINQTNTSATNTFAAASNVFSGVVIGNGGGLTNNSGKFSFQTQVSDSAGTNFISNFAGAYMRTVTLTNDLRVLHATNSVAGADLLLKIYTAGADRNLSFPKAWGWISTNGFVIDGDYYGIGISSNVAWARLELDADGTDPTNVTARLFYKAN
jgi:hypothetical protein